MDEVEFQTALENALAFREITATANIIEGIARSEPRIWGDTILGIDKICPDAVITLEPPGSVNPILSVDFGQSCACLDGRTRSGGLVGDFVGNWKDTGSYVNISVDDHYQVDGVDYQMSIFVRQKGLNTAGNWERETQTHSSIIRTTQGTTLYDGQQVIEWLSGESTEMPDDDQYAITGRAFGIATNELDLTMEVSQPLILRANCAYFQSGIMEITPGERALRTLNFGSGGCDNQANFTMGEFSDSVTLP